MTDAMIEAVGTLDLNIIYSFVLLDNLVIQANI